MPIIQASKIQFIVNDVNSLLPLPIHTNSKQSKHSHFHLLLTLWGFFALVQIYVFFSFTVEIQFRRFNTLPKKSKLGKSIVAYSFIHSFIRIISFFSASSLLQMMIKYRILQFNMHGVNVFHVFYGFLVRARSCVCVFVGSMGCVCVLFSL